jgi:hypothetical protein
MLNQGQIEYKIKQLEEKVRILEKNLDLTRRENRFLANAIGIADYNHRLGVGFTNPFGPNYLPTPTDRLNRLETDQKCLVDYINRLSYRIK